MADRETACQKPNGARDKELIKRKKKDMSKGKSTSPTKLEKGRV